MTPPALAVDAGQTEIRAALFTERGSRLAVAPGVLPIDGERVGPAHVAGSLLRAVDGLGDLPPEVVGVGVGLSGFETARGDDLAAIAAALRQALSVREVAIASDGVTSLLGALGDRPGCVVAAGTGTIVVARNGDAWAKVDGWGALLGDAGSGFAIGRAGLDAALRSCDGREDGSDALRAVAEQHFGSLVDMPALVRRTPSWSGLIAGFARPVAEVADAGDAKATQILARAGYELAVSAATALRRVFPQAGGVVSYTGNAFQAGRLLLDSFEDELRIRRPGTEVVAPAGDSLAGAALLPGIPPEPGLVWSAG